MAKNFKKANNHLTTVNARSVGIDVHKDKFVACFEEVICGADAGNDSQTHEEYLTVAGSLADRAALIAWVKERNPSVIIMESTGIYWKALFKEMEEAGLEANLINPRHFHRSDEGRKTDTADALFLASLGRLGLFKASFIPCEPYRTLRLFVVAHHKNTTALVANKNRLQKILDDAGIHLGNVFSDPTQGKSAQAVLQLLIDDELTLENVKACLQRRCKATPEQVMAACAGTLTPAARELLRMYMEQIRLISQHNERLEAFMEEKLNDDKWAIELLQSIPGVDHDAAVSMISIFGTDLKNNFPSASAFVRWAGVCPGNNESAGVRKSTKCPHGLKTIKTIAVECAQAAARTKQTSLHALFCQKRHKGYCAAIMVVAHKILRVIYSMLTRREAYCDSKMHLEEFLQRRHVPRWVKQQLKLRRTMLADQEIIKVKEPVCVEI